MLARTVGYILCVDPEETPPRLPPDPARVINEPYVCIGVKSTNIAKMLHHAEFFIGLSSGLSWLAWAAWIQVVLISVFTLPICEFKTPYRVHNTHVCHGWDAIDVNFDHHDYFWCPRHKGTERQFECSRAITSKQVINTIERLRQDFKLSAPKER